MFSFEAVTTRSYGYVFRFRDLPEDHMLPVLDDECPVLRSRLEFAIENLVNELVLLPDDR